MFRRVASWLAFTAIFQIMGGHWVVLQSVAWGKMLVNYSQEAGLIRGAEKTFSGEYPCSMCHQVRKEVQKENSDPIQSHLIKLLKQSEILPDSLTHFVFESIVHLSDYSSEVFSFTTRADAPLTPPPLV